jgi:hypothetical protein
MNAARFWQGVLAAALLALLGALVFHSLTPLIGSSAALRSCVLGLGAAYLGLIMQQHQLRVGRVIAVLAWLLASAALIVMAPSLWVWLLVQSVAIWLLRSVASYERIGYALVDATLCVIAVGAAIAAARHSGSLALALWCYFLLQALSAAIPARPANATATATASDAPFESALHSAEAALRRMSRSTTYR